MSGGPRARVAGGARAAQEDRALAALTGLALGDALGMPTQLLSPDEVAARYGRVDRLLPAADDHPIAAGLAAGSVTDDTEQAILLARTLVEGGGRVDARAWASRLVAWEDAMRARGSLDLLGPSTRAAVAALAAGASPEESGRAGTTNGAAMRVTPVGIAAAPEPLAALVDLVEEASRGTHGTGVAIAGAAAVAAVVSAGVDGADAEAAIALGVAAAEEGARRGRWVAAGDVAERIRWSVATVRRHDERDALALLVRMIGTSLAAQESVPLAVGLVALHPADPWAACCAAATLGGDADTIGAMAGAMTAALGGTGALPSREAETVVRVNGLDLVPVVQGLLELRWRRAS